MNNIIIIPTYNERENILSLVPIIFETVPEISIAVADDNSPDGTSDAVRDLQKIYPRLSLITRNVKNGLGRAYTNAFSKVLKDDSLKNVIMMDADFSHDPVYLKEMLVRAEKYSVVIGSRYVAGGKTVGWELWRRILSFMGNFYCRTITGMPIMDCTGGFNVIRAQLLRKIDFEKMDMSGYAFIMEIKYLLYKAGGTFFEVPIIFKNRARGETKITGHIISEGIIAPWKIKLTK